MTLVWNTIKHAKDSWEEYCPDVDGVFTCASHLITMCQGVSMTTNRYCVAIGTMAPKNIQPTHVLNITEDTSSAAEDQLDDIFYKWVDYWDLEKSFFILIEDPIAYSGKVDPLVICTVTWKFMCKYQENLNDKNVFIEKLRKFYHDTDRHLNEAELSAILADKRAPGFHGLLESKTQFIPSSIFNQYRIAYIKFGYDSDLNDIRFHRERIVDNLIEGIKRNDETHFPTFSQVLTSYSKSKNVKSRFPRRLQYQTILESLVSQRGSYVKGGEVFPSGILLFYVGTTLNKIVEYTMTFLGDRTSLPLLTVASEIQYAPGEPDDELVHQTLMKINGEIKQKKVEVNIKRRLFLDDSMKNQPKQVKITNETSHEQQGCSMSQIQYGDCYGLEECEPVEQRTLTVTQEDIDECSDLFNVSLSNFSEPEPEPVEVPPKKCEEEKKKEESPLSDIFTKPHLYDAKRYDDELLFNELINDSSPYKDPCDDIFLSPPNTEKEPCETLDSNNYYSDEEVESTQYLFNCNSTPEKFPKTISNSDIFNFDAS